MIDLNGLKSIIQLSYLNDSMLEKLLKITSSRKEMMPKFSMLLSMEKWDLRWRKIPAPGY